MVAHVKIMNRKSTIETAEKTLRARRDMKTHLLPSTAGIWFCSINLYVHYMFFVMKGKDVLFLF